MTAYVKNYPGGWKNKPDTTTPILATQLDNIETQYEKAVAEAAAEIASHAALTTGVHGVGAGTVAKITDIATDANLSASAQDAITKKHTRAHALDNASDHTAGTAGDILIAGAAGAWTRLAKGLAHQRLVMDSSGAYPSWQDEIFVLALQIGNGVDVITTGVKGSIPMFVGMELTEWSIVSILGVSGSIQLDLWVDSEANQPSTIADTIVASDKPKIVTSTKANGTAMTGWTKVFASGTKRYMYVNVDSCTSIKQITFALTAKKRL